LTSYSAHPTHVPPPRSSFISVAGGDGDGPWMARRVA
jgi:hypothetical protein